MRATRVWVLAMAVLGVALGVGAAGPVARWLSLAADGTHDPRNPGLALLQQPAEALSRLPPDSAGNKVRWVQALDSGAIDPRSQLNPGTKVRVLDQDLIIARNGSMPAVRFPHRPHTLWLDCSNCHDQLFKAKAGANRFSMVAILNGEQCGLCHGAVAFPLTECNRCHSVPNRLAPPLGVIRPASAPAGGAAASGGALGAAAGAPAQAASR